MGRFGGTHSIVYYMCALQGDELCETSRWLDPEHRSQLAEHAVRLLQLHPNLIRYLYIFVNDQAFPSVLNTRYMCNRVLNHSPMHSP